MQLAEQALALVGSFSDQRAINQVLSRADDFFNLITPSTSCARLPSGCEVVFAMIPIYPIETYKVGGGKVGLGRAALMRLAGAVGVKWDDEKSGRKRDEDDPVHPHYVHWHAVGKYRDFTNEWLPLVGDGLIDLRDGSAQALKVLASAEEKTRDGKVVMTKEQAGEIQLRDRRAKALELAQSGAKLRAIRDIPGLTRAYGMEELWDATEVGKHNGYPVYEYAIRRPFLVGRLQYVGVGDREDRAAIRASFLGSSAELFGMPADPPHARLPDITTDGEVVEETFVCEYCGGSDDVREVRDHQGHPIHACKGEKCQDLCHRNARGPQPEPKPKPPAPTTNTAKPATTPAKQESISVAVCRFGNCAGQSISVIPAEELRWYSDQIRRSINDPGKAKYRLANEKHLVDLTEEMARRANRGAEAESQIDPADGDDDIPY